MDIATAIPVASPTDTAVAACSSAGPQADAGFAVILAQLNIAQGSATTKRCANDLRFGIGKQACDIATAGNITVAAAANCVPAHVPAAGAKPTLLSMPDVIGALVNGIATLKTSALGQATPAPKGNPTPLTENTTAVSNTPGAKPSAESVKPSEHTAATRKTADKETKSANTGDADDQPSTTSSATTASLLLVTVATTNDVTVLKSVDEIAAAQASDAKPAANAGTSDVSTTVPLRAAAGTIPFPAATPTSGKRHAEPFSASVYPGDGKPTANSEKDQQKVSIASELRSTQEHEDPRNSEAGASHLQTQKLGHPTITHPTAENGVRHPEVVVATPQSGHKVNSSPAVSKDPGTSPEEHDHPQPDTSTHTEETATNHKEGTNGLRQPGALPVVFSVSGTSSVQPVTHAANSLVGGDNNEIKVPVQTPVDRPAAHSTTETSGIFEPSDSSPVATEPAHIADSARLQSAVRGAAGVSHSEMRVVLNGATDPVEVRAIMHDNQIGATIGVRDHELRGVLQSEIANLREHLDERNVALHDLSVVDHGANGRSMDQMPSEDHHADSRSQSPALPAEVPAVRTPDSVDIEVEAHVAVAPGRLSVRV